MSETIQPADPNTELVVHTTPAPLSNVSGEGTDYSAQQLIDMANALEPFTTRNITRRTILGFGKKVCELAAVSSVLHYVEQPIMDAVYAQHDTKLIYSGKNVRRPVKNAGLASQGWGITKSSSIVNALLDEEVYNEDFPFAAYRCSSKRVKRQDIEKCGESFADFLDPKEVDLHTVSEGLMIALTGARAAGRHLRMVSSYDAPTCVDDVYHSTLAKGVALADKLGIYHGGILGKLVTCMFEEIDRDGFIQLFTGWRQATQSTFSDGDPRMMDSELAFLDETDLLRDWRSFRGIIDKDTQVVMLRTKETRTDHIVKDMRADERLVEMYENLGTTPVLIEVDEPGHAKTGAGIAAGAPHYKHLLAAA